MRSSIANTFVAALAFGATNALPQAIVSTTSATAPLPTATLINNGPVDNTELIAKLKTDPTVIKRFRRLLTNNGQQLINAADLAKATIFDFNKNTVPIPGAQGGVVSQANIETFPILIDTGITMNFGTIGPCGILLPHVHPRAHEYFVTVEGEVDFGYMLELGLLKDVSMNPAINGTMKKYQSTLFPQGSIHYQLNNSPDCKPATVFATLSSENAGTTTVLQAPPAVNGTVVPRQVDGKDFESVRALLPPNIVSVIDKCLARCGAS